MEEEENKILINRIKNNLPSNINLELIDNYKIDNFIESQAFAFLAVRSIKVCLFLFHKQQVVKNQHWR